VTPMLTLDTRGFDRALVQYAAASGKDHADIVNHKLKDAAYRSIKHVRQADKTAIRALRTEYRLIAYILRRKKGNAMQTPMYFRKTKAGVKSYRGTGKYYTRQEAREFAKKWVGAKGRAVSFMKSWFLRAAKGMERYIRGDGVFVPPAPKFGDIALVVRPATKASPAGMFEVRYGYRKRGSKTAQGAERILYRALQRGIDEVTADIGAYVRRKVQETARKFSVV